MYHALDMGVSAEAFWDMSARAVVLLHQELRRGVKGAAGKAQPVQEKGGAVRLNYIPRP